jgi:hypothetical protein
MTDLQKQALKEIYQTASESQKDGLKINFPEAFALQNDVWYTYTDVEGYLIKFTDVDNELGFGFSPYAGWNREPKPWATEDLVEATPKQIEEVLHKVAVDKGLVDGQRVIDGNAFYTINGELYYSHIDDALHDENHLPIFDGREWPEKVPAATRMSKEMAGEIFNIEIVY